MNKHYLVEIVETTTNKVVAIIGRKLSERPIKARAVRTDLDEYFVREVV
jgi:hypothetical protein